MDNDTSTPYQPIDRGRYSEYEVAILHRQRLRLVWVSPQGQRHIDVVLPRDLQTRQGEEFLIADTREGDTLSLRLDRISACESV